MAKVKAFRCSHSGKYYPHDYAKEWGRKYGIGLGPVPVSECLDTIEGQPIVESSDDEATLMRPVGVTCAQVDFVEVEESEYEANRLILAIEDPRMITRSEILRRNQRKKSASMEQRFKLLEERGK